MCMDGAKLIRISLHFDSFIRKPSVVDFSLNSSTYFCKLLGPSLQTDSDKFESSAYFHKSLT